MTEAKSGDSGVVHLGAGHLPRSQQSLEHRPITGRFTQQDDARRRKQNPDLFQRLWQLRWRAVNPWVGGDGQELMDAGPRDRPGSRTFYQGPQSPLRRLEPGRIPTMGIDQEVGVDCDQAPRPL